MHSDIYEDKFQDTLRLFGGKTNDSLRVRMKWSGRDRNMIRVKEMEVSIFRKKTRILCVLSEKGTQGSFVP